MVGDMTVGGGDGECVIGGGGSGDPPTDFSKVRTFLPEGRKSVSPRGFCSKVRQSEGCFRESPTVRECHVIFVA